MAEIGQKLTAPELFKWTKQREDAAELLAEDEFTDTEIAELVGVTRATLYNWKQIQSFADRVQVLTRGFGDAINRRVIAKLVRRLDAQQKRWFALQQVIAERSEDLDMQTVPGGRTGLLVRRLKMVGENEVTEYEVDTGTLKALLDIEREVAAQLGQRQETVRVKHGQDPDAKPIQHEHNHRREPVLPTDPAELRKLPPDEILRRLRSAIQTPSGN